MADLVSISTIEVKYENVRLVVRRSKVRDVLKRDLIEEALKKVYDDITSLGMIGVFAKVVTQTCEASGLPFDPTGVTAGNAQEAFESFLEFDEPMVDRWYGSTLAVNAPVNPALAAGVETDKLKKKTNE